jgi:hypothetical protein
MNLVLSGTSYFAALSDVEPLSVTAMGFGCRVTLEAPDSATREAWIDRMIECATDMADEGKWDVTEAIYKDVERADKARVAA